jgi:hypothetical protein
LYGERESGDGSEGRDAEEEREADDHPSGRAEPEMRPGSREGEAKIAHCMGPPNPRAPPRHYFGVNLMIPLPGFPVLAQ